MIKPVKYIWMDGKLVFWKSAKVHILTHSLHYGSSVFEGIHSYKSGSGTCIFRLDDHINRLFNSAQAIGIKIKFSKEKIKNAIKQLIKANKIGEGYIRPLAYYGYGNVGVFPKDVPSNISIITIHWGSYYSKPLNIMVSSYMRHSEKSTVYGTKMGGNYVNSILAMHEARAKNYDEALMLDLDGYVSEGPAENIFAVIGGEIIAPQSQSALPGITRDSIIKIANDLGINSHEKKLTLDEIKNADELFFCGTATEIAPIISIDSEKIGNGNVGKITSAIKEKYDLVVRGKDIRYLKWLTYVK